MMASLKEDAMTSSLVNTIRHWMKQVLAIGHSNGQRLAYWESDVSYIERETAPAVLVYATDQGWQRVRQRMYDFAC
jgi:arabinogalactan endo-1,4-beta-galactosidase